MIEKLPKMKDFLHYWQFFANKSLKYVAILHRDLKIKGHDKKITTLLSNQRPRGNRGVQAKQQQMQFINSQMCEVFFERL